MESLAWNQDNGATEVRINSLSNDEMKRSWVPTWAPGTFYQNFDTCTLVPMPIYAMETEFNSLIIKSFICGKDSWKNIPQMSFLSYTDRCCWNSRVFGSNTETIFKKWNLCFWQINLHTFLCLCFSEISLY